MKVTEEQLRATFTEGIVGPLIECLQRAYEANFAYFDPEIGHDGMTFGLQVYKSKVHFISQLAEEHPQINVVHRHPFFCFRIDRFNLSTYRAGDSGDADISESFPRNRTRAAKIVERNQQLSLFELLQDPNWDDAERAELILADIGNPTDGLCKVFLGVPIEAAADGRITKWEVALELWRNDDALPITTTSPNNNLPTVESAAPPEITLKPPTEDVFPPAISLRKDASDEKKESNEPKQ